MALLPSTAAIECRTEYSDDQTNAESEFWAWLNFINPPLAGRRPTAGAQAAARHRSGGWHARDSGDHHASGAAASQVSTGCSALTMTGICHRRFCRAGYGQAHAGRGHEVNDGALRSRAAARGPSGTTIKGRVARHPVIAVMGGQRPRCLPCIGEPCSTSRRRHPSQGGAKASCGSSTMAAGLWTAMTSAG
jgi:hypothetical protein